MPLKINNLSQMMNNCGNSNVTINIDKSFLETLMGVNGNVSITMNADQLRQIFHDAEMYRKYDKTVKQSAKNWDSLHPAVQRMLLEYKDQPFNIYPC